MTINKYDKYALLPKKCDKCRRTFILEPYNIYYKQVGIDNFDLPQIYCRECSEIREKVKRFVERQGGVDGRD